MTTQKVRINVDELIEFLEVKSVDGIYENGKEAYIDAVKMVGYTEVEFTIKKD